MCKLATIVKSEGANEEAETLLRLQFAELRTQKDGCAGLTIGFDNKVRVYRELTDYDKVFQSVLADLPTSKLVSIHTRIGTSGEKELTNVHFFKPKDWYFAHNGFVQKYHTKSIGYLPWGKTEDDYEYLDDDMPPPDFGSTKPISFGNALNEMVNCRGCYTAKKGYCKKHASLVDEIKEQEIAREKKNRKKTKTLNLTKAKIVVDSKKFCDSYQFVENMPTEVNEESILKHCRATDFSGMGILVSEDGTKVYLIIAKECFSVSDNKTFAGYFSYNPEMELSMKSENEVYGVKVASNNINLSVNEDVCPIIRGVYRVNAEKI